MRESNLSKDYMPSENHIKWWSNSMVFGFENIMDFTIDIDKLNLANLVGKVMDKIMVVPYQIILPLCTEKSKLEICWKSQNLYCCIENHETSSKTIFYESQSPLLLQKITNLLQALLGLIRPYLGSLTINVKMLECLCRYHDVKLSMYRSIAALSL